MRNLSILHAFYIFYLTALTAAMKWSRMELDLITDQEMYLTFEQGLR